MTREYFVDQWIEEQPDGWWLLFDGVHSWRERTREEALECLRSRREHARRGSRTP